MLILMRWFLFAIEREVTLIFQNIKLGIKKNYCTETKTLTETKQEVCFSESPAQSVLIVNSFHSCLRFQVWWVCPAWLGVSMKDRIGTEQGKFWKLLHTFECICPQFVRHKNVDEVDFVWFGDVPPGTNFKWN